VKKAFACLYKFQRAGKILIKKKAPSSATLQTKALYDAYLHRIETICKQQ